MCILLRNTKVRHRIKEFCFFFFSLYKSKRKSVSKPFSKKLDREKQVIGEEDFRESILFGKEIKFCD